MGYKWDRETVIDHIRRRKTRGRSMKAGDVRRDSPTLYYAAKYHFGSFKVALEAETGCQKPTEVVLQITYDRTGIIEHIRVCYESGADLSYTAMKNAPIFKHAKRIFGSWRACIEAAGYQYVEVQRYGWGAARAIREE